jgi:demethylmenaquinone methyltransferase/2-methoxy-6-polyprenyl-1,4-benzoquinol methylase
MPDTTPLNASDSPDVDSLLAEQVAYYEARAPEYDRMLDAGNGYNDALGGLTSTVVEDALASSPMAGDALEIACGTGLWTRRLLRHVTSVTALDASPAMLDLHAHRVPEPNVRRLRADVFDWTPDRAYDAVFFSFWLSHVPPDRFDVFWQVVADALRPAGSVFFVDERAWDGHEAHERQLGDARGTTLRRLDDGREYRMVKRYYEPAELQQRLAPLGWNIAAYAADERIIYGSGRRR